MKDIHRSFTSIPAIEISGNTFYGALKKCYPFLRETLDFETLDLETLDFKTGLRPPC